MRERERERVKIIHLKPILLKLISVLNGLTTLATPDLQQVRKALLLFNEMMHCFLKYRPLERFLNDLSCEQVNQLLLINKSKVKFTAPWMM